MGELYDAIREGDAETIAGEAADVANFAMMIADVAAYDALTQEQQHDT